MKKLLAFLLPLALTLSLTACAPRDEQEDENAQYSEKPVIYLYPEEEQDETCDAKPVAYLYPQTETEITVQLDYDGELTCTYPAYADGWTVSARPDGTLTDKDGKTPWWALLGAGAFALFAAIASFGIGSAVQSSAMTEVISTNLPGVPAWGIGLAIVIMVSVVIFGGVKVISNVCEKLVPFMAIAYIWGCVVILGMNWEFVWPALCLIVESAFTAKAAFGGALGSGLMLALQFGCARGLFSNESGLGSAPIVASAASTRNPARQALVSMTGTFWDTVIICLLTGLVLVSTMLGNADLNAAVMAGDISAGAQLSSAAFASIPYIGTPILIFGMILFAYSTILGWSYYGNRCVTYLFGKRAIRPYQVLYVVVAFLGAIGVGEVVWTVSDITNALMAIPNIIMVLLLSGLIAKETKHYVYEHNLDERDETPIPQLDSK